MDCETMGFFVERRGKREKSIMLIVNRKNVS